MLRYAAALLVPLVGIYAHPASAVGDGPYQPVEVVLRADWQNPTRAVWRGQITLSQGKFLSVAAIDPRLEGCHRVAETAGGGATAVEFSSAGPGSSAGLMVKLAAPPDAFVELAMEGRRLQVRLSELLDGSPASINWTGSARLYRDPADILQLGMAGSHGIFGPGQRASLDLKLNLQSRQPRPVPTKLGVLLRRAGDSAVLVRGQWQLTVPAGSPAPLHRQLEIRMPQREGVYVLMLRAEPAGNRPVQRQVQFVVLDTGPDVLRRVDQPDTEVRLVQEFDPAALSPAEHWTSLRLFSRTARLGQAIWQSIWPLSEEVDGSPLDRLYELHPGKIGRPHRLTVEYEADAVEWLAAAVVESSGGVAAGRRPVGFALGQDGTGRTLELAAGHILFWPRSPGPALALQVRGDGGLKAIKRVRLEEFTGGLPPFIVQRQARPARTLALFVAEPDAWRAFVDDSEPPAWTTLAQDDWQTFFQCVQRLCQYARFAGYNCLAPVVLSDGVALYPSELLDHGTCFGDDSQTPARSQLDRKDYVELLLRICQRYGLQAMPALRLNGRVPALERRLRRNENGDHEDDVRLLITAAAAGQASSGSLNRRYNPLEPTVQEALVAVVGEFAARYGRHQCFSGLVLDLTADTHLVLPDWQAGLDRASLERFLHQAGLKVPAGQAHLSPRQLLTGPLRTQWLRWRCRQLNRLYERLLAELRRFNPRARLVLALTMFAGNGAEQLRQALHDEVSLQQLLMSKGVGLADWRPPSGLVVLRPYFAAASRPEQVHVNNSGELDRLMAGMEGRGGICLTEPEPLLLPAALGNSDAKPLAARLTRVPALGQLQHCFARCLGSADSQIILHGGPVLPLGQEGTVHQFARTFRSLPAGNFRSITVDRPVVARLLRHGHDTLLYLVNEADYSVRGTLELHGPDQTTAINLSNGQVLETERSPAGLALNFTLAPFQLLPLRFPGAAVTINQCTLHLPPVAEKGLKRRFERLSRAMDILRREAPRTVDGLPPNGDFEKPASQSNDLPAQWTPYAHATCTLDRQRVHGGTYAVRLSGGAGSGLRSAAFRPVTRNVLAMDVWVRAERPGQRLRWILVGKHGGTDVYRSSAEVTLTAQWQAWKMRAPDLPGDPQMQVECRFELPEPGTVWIDDAQLCALPISPKEQRAIVKAWSAALKAWTDRRLNDFQKVADGYWARYLIQTVEQSAAWARKRSRKEGKLEMM